MKFLTYLMSLILAPSSFAEKSTSKKSQPIVAAATKKLCKLSGPANSKAIAAIDVIDAKDRNPPIEHIVASEPSYDRSLIRAAVDSDCKVKELNQILKANQACIVLYNGISVVFQIPDPKESENYERIVKAFEKSGCLKDVGPILDVVPM